MNYFRPKVVKWFKVYCWVLAVLYLFVVLAGLLQIILGIVFSGDPEYLASCSNEDMPPVVMMIMGGVFLSMGLVLLVLSLMGVFLTPRPWVWVFSLVLICLGMTSACFLPFCIPLLLFWIKPETKDYYGRRDSYPEV